MIFEDAPKNTLVNLPNNYRDVANNFSKLISNDCKISDIEEFIKSLENVVKNENTLFLTKHIKQRIVNNYLDVFPSNLVELIDKISCFDKNVEPDGDPYSECTYYNNYSFKLCGFIFSMSLCKERKSYGRSLKLMSDNNEYNVIFKLHGLLSFAEEDLDYTNPESNAMSGFLDTYTSKNIKQMKNKSQEIQGMMNIQPTVSPYMFALFILTLFGKENLMEAFGFNMLNA